MNTNQKSDRRCLVYSLLLLVLMGCSEDPVLVEGKQIFKSYCAVCHQAEGNGIPGTFPSLHASEWISGDKGRLIRLALKGMQGPIVVNGESYNNVMTPHGFLNDQQLSAVLTFVRQEFENNGDPVSAEEIGWVRASLNSDDLFIASELAGMTGIPQPSNE
ncbi:MAG: cytochrome c [Bacteroidetes bacterium]|nr:cytochrome c [Bacteroidota bacterium]